MRLTVSHDLDRLQRDLERIPGKIVKGAERAGKKRAEQGNRLAKADAKKKAGQPGRHYPESFTVEHDGLMTWVYGPDASFKQGGMDFEWGRGRQTKPHKSLSKSADKVGPKFWDDIDKLIGRVFW